MRQILSNGIARLFNGVKQRARKLVMCFREPPGPVEGAPIYPQGYVPFHEVVYEAGEIAVVKNDNAGSWVVCIKKIEL